jgi:hypothetical protein
MLEQPAAVVEAAPAGAAGGIRQDGRAATG